VPKTGAAGERLLSLLRALHERHADASGFVTLVYDGVRHRGLLFNQTLKIGQRSGLVSRWSLHHGLVDLRRQG
jgi:hypothetical protein